MTKIIGDESQPLIEETIDLFLNKYYWMHKRLVEMDQAHRDAVGILLETHPSFMNHLQEIFDRNLDECGSSLKEEGHWYVKRDEYVLMGTLGIPSDGDELHLLDFKPGSGIIGLDGTEFDSTKAKAQ